jgi:hypothetical protein
MEFSLKQSHCKHTPLKDVLVKVPPNPWTKIVKNIL